MGYRSNVAYTIRFHEPKESDLEKEALLAAHQNLFYSFVAEAKANPETALAMSEVTIDSNKRHINFIAEDVKWYDDYEGVKSHMKLVALAREYCDENKVTSYRKNEYDEKTSEFFFYPLGMIYVRFGEESDDNEEEFVGEYQWDWCYISRQIILDWA